MTKHINAQNNKPSKLRKQLSRFLIIGGLLFILIPGYLVGTYLEDAYISEKGNELAAEFVVKSNAYVEKEGSSEGEEEKENPIDPNDLMDINAMKEVNPDTYGYLKFQDKELPVVKSEDTKKYLKYGWDGAKTSNGTIFVDPACDEDSKNIVIYGHHMKSGRMFGELNKYLNEDYRNEYPTFKWITESFIDNYEIIAIIETKAAELNSVLDMDSDDDLTALSEKVKKSGKLYGEFLPDQTYMTLATCEYHYKNGRLFVIGRQISHRERPDAEITAK